MKNCYFKNSYEMTSNTKKSIFSKIIEKLQQYKNKKSLQKFKNCGSGYPGGGSQQHLKKYLD